MKEITITIQPCKSPVTITIHPNGKVVNSDDPTTQSRTSHKRKPGTLPKKESTIWNVEYQRERAKEFLEEQGGFCMATQIYHKLFQRSGVQEIVLEPFIRLLVKKTIGQGKAATYYVLPEKVDEFRKFAKKEKWIVIE